MAGTPDITLLERWVAHRDAEAFAELVRRHASMVYATCRRVLGSEAGADDVAQECFTEVAQLASAARVESSLGGWLHTVATRRALNRVRAEARRRKRERQYAAHAPMQAEADPDDVQPHLDEAIAALPEKLRVPLVAHFLEGKTHQELADMLGLPRTTVTSRVAKGIDEVRRRLKRRGIVIGVSGLVSLLTVESAQAAPPALVAALGKMALLGKAAMPVVQATSPVSTLATIGGALMSTKKILIIVAILAILAGDYFLVRDYINPASPGSGETKAVSGATPSSEQGSGSESTNGVASASNASRQTGHSAASVGGNNEASALASDSGVTGTISGVVEDAQGVPVANADVKARRASAEKVELSGAVTSDDQGHFVLSNLPEDTYALTGSMSGKGFGSVRGVKPGADKIVIKLGAGATITGRVYDLDTGEGIEGVLLLPVNEKAEGGREMMIVVAACQQQRTGTDGTYSINVPAPATYRLLPMETPGYEQPMRMEECPRADVKEGATCAGVDLALVAGASITGHVYDADGKGLAGAELSLIDKRMMSNAPSGKTVSGSDGAYTFTGLRRNWTYSVRATYTGLAPVDSEPVTLEGANSVDGVDIYLRPGHAIYGRVVTTSGQGAPGVEVILLSGADGDFVAISSLNATAGENGAFWIANVAGGAYRTAMKVVGRVGGDATTVTGPSFTMPSDADLHDLELVVGPGTEGFISGRITDAETGAPLAGTMIGAHSANAHGWTKADDNGFYRLEGLGCADTWSMEMFATGEYDHEVRKDVPVNSEGVDFARKKGGCIRGIVTDGSTGEPVTRFEVQYGEIWREFSSATGQFSASPIVAETISLKVRADGYTLYTSDPIDMSSGTVDGVQIVLMPGEGVTGAIIDGRNGSPIQGARVTAFEGTLNAGMLTDGMIWSKSDPVTDARGHYELYGIAPGAPANLVAWRAGYAPSVVMNSVDGQVDFVLTPGGAITGTAYNGEQPVANASIWVIRLGDGTFPYEAQAYTSPSGEFSISNLPIGGYSVRCLGEPPDTSPPLWEGQARVEDGQQVQVTAQLGQTN